MSAWYIAHDDELLVDLDRCYRKHEKSGRLEGEIFFKHRLYDAEDAGLFELHDFGTYLIASATPGHMHGYVRLKRPMALVERLTWQSWTGSDFLRSRADWMRFARGIKYPSILEEPAAIRNFYRGPDYVCECPGKHKSEERPDCEVWRLLRGADIYELFGRPTKLEDLAVLPLVEGRQDLERDRKLRRMKKDAQRRRKA
jgi:hypothetical protein